MYTANKKQLESFREEHDYLTKKLELGKEVLWLTREECIEAGPSIDETLEIVEKTMIAHGKKACEMPAKVGVHPYEDVFFHAMPAYVPDMLACGCKWIECFPRNPLEFNLPQTTGLQIMNDIETGVPTAVMDCTWLTAMRTPAVTSLAAGKLHPKAETFGMFGCGVQGVNHIKFIGHVLKNLKKVYVYDIREEMADSLIENTGAEVAFEIIKASSPQEVAENCQVLSSATIILREPLCIVKDEWIQKGQTVIPCDMNTYFDPKIPKRADKYFLDSIDEHRLFAQMGYFPDGMAEVYGETGELLAELKPGRETEEELIVCSNIGVSINDVSMGRAILKNALEKGIGKKMCL